LNDKGQLGGLNGSKLKRPTFNEILTSLKPIEIVGGSKSLFIVSNEGKVLNIFILFFSMYYSLKQLFK